MDKVLSSIRQASYGQLWKLLIITEPGGIFRSHVAYLFILHCPGTGMHNDDEASLSIILVNRDLVVKILITLETHGIF